MPTLKFPLSGDVNQLISPWTAFFSPFGNQYGLINISLGRSSAPEVEQEVLAEVGSYGKQLGRMGDALAVLLDRLPRDPPLSKEQEDAIDALQLMLREINDIKESHGRQTVKV